VPPKRWSMASFKQPLAASAALAEAPFSVVLELYDEGRVQFACDDGESRGQVLECEFSFFLYFFSLVRLWLWFVFGMWYHVMFIVVLCRKSWT